MNSLVITLSLLSFAVSCIALLVAFVFRKPGPEGPQGLTGFQGPVGIMGPPCQCQCKDANG